MATPDLGQLEEVDVRQIWSDEARDFTPWLSKHLSRLGDAIGIRLELVGSEQPVGDFSADVVADGDLGSVVIENQLERTDHTHLGQLLTYAAGHDARVLIWVTREVRDEHRAAIDWLNRFTVGEVEVYAVEVRAVRIGESLPAPEFRVVAFPNDWSRQSRKKGTENSSSSYSSEQYREFYRPVVDAMRQRDLTEQLQPYGYYAQRFSTKAEIDKAEYMVSMTTPASGDMANVYLYLGSNDRDVNLKVFGALEEQRAEVEHELGASLVWAPYRGYRTSISLTRPASISDPPEEQSETQAWMIEWLPRVREVFEPRLLRISEDLKAKKSDGVEGSLVGDGVE